MNIHEAQRIAPVITAFANGKEIEYKYKNGQWISSTEPTFCPDYEWRIKPELKYHPFTYNVAIQHIGRIICRKGQRGHYQIIGANDFGVMSPDLNCSYQNLFDYYIFDDGTPCGILE